MILVPIKFYFMILLKLLFSIDISHQIDIRSQVYCFQRGNIELWKYLNKLISLRPEKRLNK